MLLAILAATIAGWIFGAVWYGVLGKSWAAALGKPDIGGQVPVVPMIVSVLCEAIMATVFAILLRHVAGEGATILDGMATGALLWFGFVATALVTNHAYAGAKRALTMIDGGHWLGVLLIQGAVLAALA